MSIAVALGMQLTVTETLDSVTNPFASSTSRDKEIVHNGLNTSVTLPSTSPAVPATQVAFGQLALSSGAGAIDLRTLTGTNGKAIDGNGLKVQAVIFRNKSTNTNPITLSEGTSNGYELLGNGFTLKLTPGQVAQFYLRDAAPDVGASAKTIDIAGTGSEVLEYLVVLG